MDKFALFPFSIIYCYQDQLYEPQGLLNPYPFLQFGFNFFQDPENYFKVFRAALQREQTNFGENDSSKTHQKGNNVQTKEKDHQTSSDHVKLQEKQEQIQKGKKWENKDFIYYDPGEAPYLTFGIRDIKLKEKKNPLKIQNENPEKIDVYFSSYQQKQKLSNLKTQMMQQIHVTQPDSRSSPFLIIKARPIKRRLLSLEQYEKRAEEIEKRRIKNFHRLQIQERIGKKLPTKNKKWQRRKQSLVFNANEYKKNLMSSKKFKFSKEKLKDLFTTNK